MDALGTGRPEACRIGSVALVRAGKVDVKH